MINLYHLVFISITLFLTRKIYDLIKDSIISSVLATTIMVLILYMIGHEQYFAFVFGASFIGMSSREVIKSNYYYLSGPIYMLILNATKLVLVDVGGQLGFSAFLSVLVIYLIEIFTKKNSRFYKSQK